jgi:CheY-like chemotaxis protein
MSPIRLADAHPHRSGVTSRHPIKKAREPSDRQSVPPTVLVCDDEEVLRLLVRAALEPSECDIVEARDGDESLELALALEPDLIVLDVMMPGRTGLEVLSELRAEPRFAETPVIVLSARTQVADRDAVDRSGATTFMAKPFSPRQLCSAVTELLGAKR